MADLWIQLSEGDIGGLIEAVAHRLPNSEAPYPWNKLDAPGLAGKNVELMPCSEHTEVLQGLAEELEKRLKDIRIQEEDGSFADSLIARIPAYETALRLVRAQLGDPHGD